jgi:RND family efflux transporter MFP subunit
VSYAEIRSPVNGVVTDRPLYAGEIANPGAPLLTIMDVSAVVARVNMGQDQAKDVKVGNPATLTPEGGDPVPGKVTIVSPAVDPNSTTVQVWVQANNPGEKLRAGTSVHVAITAATLDGVLVPATAILSSDEGGAMVVLVDDKNIAHQRKVTIGVKEGVFVQVAAGLQPGERVVTVGGLGLEDKAKVRLLKAGEKGPGEEAEKPDEDAK